MKFIASSNALLNLLNKVFNKPLRDDVLISINNKTLFIAEEELSVEGLGPAAAKIPLRQLNRLHSVLILLSDQPLTIEYNEGNGWLTIQEIILSAC